MKPFETKDVFVAVRAMKKAGLQKKMKELFNQSYGEDVSVEEVGVSGMTDLFFWACENDSEQAIYEVVSGPFEMSPEEIAKLPLGELVEKLEVLEKDGNTKPFFNYVGRLFKKTMQKGQ